MAKRSAGKTPGVREMSPAERAARRARMPRDVRRTHDRLVKIASHALRLADHVEDIAWVASEKPVRDPDTSPAPAPRDDAEPEEPKLFFHYLDEHGLTAAKKVLARISDPKTGAYAVEQVLEKWEAALLALMAAGPGADSSLKGTLLGDEKGHGAHQELAQSLKAQRRRAERGEYTPTPFSAQPKLGRPS